MSKQSLILRSTDQVVFSMPWTAGPTSVCPWDKETHTRVVVPYTDKEMEASKNGLKCHIQIVSNNNLITR